MEARVLKSITLALTIALLSCANKPSKNSATAESDIIVRYCQKSKILEDKASNRLNGCWQPNSKAACKLDRCKQYVKLSEIISRDDYTSKDCPEKAMEVITVKGFVYNI
jgi:hypothetical protein